MVDGPVDGVMFEVEHAEFWWPSWGTVPERMADRLAIARRELAKVPRLVPLWGNEFVGSSDDSPILRIVQTDLFMEWLSLTDLAVGVYGGPYGANYQAGTVEFWSELYEWSEA
jgi:hypothetical protein